MIKISLLLFYFLFNEDYDEEAKELVMKGEYPFRFDGLKFSVFSNDSMEINKIQSNAIVISASGMCDAGRIKHQLLDSKAYSSRIVESGEEFYINEKIDKTDENLRNKLIKHIKSIDNIERLNKVKLLDIIKDFLGNCDLGNNITVALPIKIKCLARINY